MNVSNLIHRKDGEILLYGVERSIFLQKKQTSYVGSFYKTIEHAFIWIGQLANNNLYAGQVQIEKDRILDEVVGSVFRSCVRSSKVPVLACVDIGRVVLLIKRVEALATMQKLQRNGFVDAIELQSLKGDLFLSLSSLSFEKWSKIKDVCRNEPFARRILEEFHELEILQILQVQKGSFAILEFDLLCEACSCRPRDMAYISLLIEGLSNETEKFTLLRCLFIEGTVYLYSKNTEAVCKVAASFIKKQMTLTERISLIHLIQKALDDKKGDIFLDKTHFAKDLYNFIFLQLEKMHKSVESIRCFDFFCAVKSVLQNKHLLKPASSHPVFELTDKGSLFHTLSLLKNDHNNSSYPKMIALLEGFRSYLSPQLARSVCHLLEGIFEEKSRIKLLSSIQLRTPSKLSKLCLVASVLITKQMSLEHRKTILTLLDLMIRDRGEGVFPEGKSVTLCLCDYLSDRIESVDVDRRSIIRIKTYVDFILDRKDLFPVFQEDRFITLTNENSLFNKIFVFRDTYGPRVFDSLVVDVGMISVESISFMCFLMKGISNEESQCALVEDVRKIDLRDIPKIHEVASFLITEEMSFKERQVLYSVITWMIREQGEDVFLEKQDHLVSIYNHLDEKIKQVRGENKGVKYSLLGTVITVELLMNNTKLRVLSDQHPIMDKSGVFIALSLVKKTYYESRRAVCDRLFSLFEDFNEDLSPLIITQLCSWIQDFSSEEMQLQMLNELTVIDELLV